MIPSGLLFAIAAQVPSGPAPAAPPPAPPAPPYWQQRLRYEITATLDETRGTLGGAQRVVYFNNSPDTLYTFALHLYLNAFRPGSRWADADSAEGRRRFNDLRDPDYGYNRIGDVRIMGQAVAAAYPFAPDSTIARFLLPRPAAPGDSFAVELEWEARPSTLPRRQGRRGRHYDFAQWYPRVVAYDRYGWQEHPLYPAGEFYGDFGDFSVTLDLPEDQVVGATGVPVCGDPGWDRANRNPARRVELGREVYGPVTCDAGAPAAGRKRILWLARDVHHFALSMNPDYRYEGGRFGDVLVHVLYRPGDERSWGGGTAVRNTEEALSWLDGLFGPFPWPQITNVHRIEGGGTEFPMMVHNGSPGLGLILHEVGHNYLMGILANNEWKEGWLDEGFTSFQTSWYDEAHGRDGGYRALEWNMLRSDLDGWSEPASRAGEHFRDFSTYNSMIYDRGELFFHQLRAIVGDSAMRAILRTYYQRWKLKHVDEAAFREVAEEVSGRDLRALFGQWLHGTHLYDYAVGRVEVGRTDGRSGGQPEGSEYLTRVEVVRRAPGVFPVSVAVRSRGGDSARARLDGTAEREWVTLATRERPFEVELDPEIRSHDWNVLNNRKRRGLLGFRRAPRTMVYLDQFFSRPIRRDGFSVGMVPTIWYNDEGGVTLGARLRSDYLGRFEQNTGWLTLDTRRLAETDRPGIGMFLRVQNPVRFLRPRVSQSFEAFSVEGRRGLAAAAERDLTRHRTFGARRAVGIEARWLVTTNTRFLDPASWDAGGTVEASAWSRLAGRWGAWSVAGRISLGGGIEYRNRGEGLSTRDRYDAQAYFRGHGELRARRGLGASSGLSVRIFAGGLFSPDAALKQRQFFAAGADPYEQFGNPLLRSRGAVLARDGVHYLMPGGGGVRGLNPAVSAARMVAVGGELDRSVFTRNQGTWLRGIRVAAFTDWAIGDGDLPADARGAAIIGDAGVGLRLAHRIGDTFFTTRLDFPLYVSRPDLAVNAPERAIGARWVLSFTNER